MHRVSPLTIPVTQKCSAFSAVLELPWGNLTAVRAAVPRPAAEFTFSSRPFQFRDTKVSWPRSAPAIHKMRNNTGQRATIQGSGLDQQSHAKSVTHAIVRHPGA